MKIALVLILFMAYDSPKIEVIYGFNDMQLCNIAGQKIISDKNKRNSEYHCIIIDNDNKIVEKLP